jgi:iron complex outermembrane receptor protein
MTRRFIRVLAASTALTVSMPAFAQDAQADGAEASEGDIIVTARRSDERLQDIPVSVTVVTGDSLRKAAITDITELTKLAPGLTLSNNAPNTPNIVLRGVAWAPGSGTPATPVYFNEAPFDPSSTIQAIFDIGQIEVLRGPQGTTRGAPSISGAITLTTRRPDLDEIGGYVQAQYGSGDHTNFQGAINVPLIKDILAVRLAANIEDSQGDRVFSVKSTVKPLFRNRTYRATVLFKPTDTLSIQAMYQHRKQLIRNFVQVVGTGSPGQALAGIPANFNGPALTLLDRKSVQDAPGQQRNNSDHITVNASWEVLGQQLSYNFGRQLTKSPAQHTALDPLNFLPGYEPIQLLTNEKVPAFRTHEVRLSSVRAPGRFFDYDIGWFSKHSGGTIFIDAPTLLSGAFGAPGTPVGAVTTPNPRYVLGVHSDILLGQVNDSFYGNLEVHLGENTDLRGGVSRIRDRIPVTLNVTTTAASTVAATLASLGGLPCPGIPGVFVTGLVNSVYPGFCDFNIPAGNPVANQSFNDLYHATIYNFSLSHKFSPDVMVYATTGSAFRTGLPTIGASGLPAGFFVPGGERAKSYELGIKTTLGRRLRINADIFQIDYNGQLTTFEGINYWNTATSRVATTGQAFYRNVDSRVRGFELEIAANPVENLSLAANLSYSQIKSKGSTVPCNKDQSVAANVLSVANPINTCILTSGQVLNQNAPFAATLNGSYSVPIGSMEGYFRFNMNYQGENPNYGNAVKTQAYALVDLFAGVSGNDGAWDLGFYAKNVFNKQVELARNSLLNNIYPNYAGAPGGYYQARITTLPRELGVTLRYAFGSR